MSTDCGSHALPSDSQSASRVRTIGNLPTEVLNAGLSERRFVTLKIPVAANMRGKASDAYVYAW